MTLRNLLPSHPKSLSEQEVAQLQRPRSNEIQYLAMAQGLRYFKAERDGEK